MISRFRTTLWITLVAATIGMLWIQERTHRTEPSRLSQIPLKGDHFIGRDLPLNEAESAVFRRAAVLKRLYQVGSDRVVVLAIESQGDRHAVHDPTYCFRGAGWTLEQSSTLPLPGGQGRIVQLVKGTQTASAMFWITNGRERYASALRGWLASIQQRAGLSAAGRAPILVLLQPVAGTTVDWAAFCRRFPELLSL